MSMALDYGRRTFVGCREAAEAYGCTMSYLRRLARAGRVWTEKVGPRAYVFNLDEIKQLARRKDGGRLRKRAEGFKAH
jgi:hypothetical protein